MPRTGAHLLLCVALTGTRAFGGLEKWAYIESSSFPPRYFRASSIKEVDRAAGYHCTHLACPGNASHLPIVLGKTSCSPEPCDEHYFPFPCY